MENDELIAAMHNLGEDLTRMAEELAERRGYGAFAKSMLDARAELYKAYGRLFCSDTASYPPRPHIQEHTP